jgi:DNA polymerase III subunit delta'
MRLRRLTYNGRMPNSLILSGDEGVGKRQFAIEIAKTLVCTDPVGGEACDVCSACRRAEKFTLPKSDDKEPHKRVVFSEHADVGTVVPFNRNILVDAIRHLESEAQFRPYEAPCRIFIIDDADKMNDAAANALLKTLEEPPQSSYIVLVTSRSDTLLPTIRSRCQSIRFVPITAEEIENYLISDRAFTSDEARLASRLARGSLGRAVSMQMEEIRRRREAMMAVVSVSLEDGGIAAALKISEGMNDAKDKSAFEENLDLLQSLIHDVWAISVSGDHSRIINSDLEARLILMAAEAGKYDLPRWIEAIDTLRENLDININRKIATDALFVEMAA